jgi:hypothetical protein
VGCAIRIRLEGADRLDFVYKALRGDEGKTTDLILYGNAFRIKDVYAITAILLHVFGAPNRYFVRRPMRGVATFARGQDVIAVGDERRRRV